MGKVDGDKGGLSLGSNDGYPDEATDSSIVGGRYLEVEHDRSPG